MKRMGPKCMWDAVHYIMCVLYYAVCEFVSWISHMYCVTFDIVDTEYQFRNYLFITRTERKKQITITNRCHAHPLVVDGCCCCCCSFPLGLVYNPHTTWCLCVCWGIKKLMNVHLYNPRIFAMFPIQALLYSRQIMN